MTIKQKQTILLFLVIITMLSISQLFGSTKENTEYPYMSRQINLSGNIIDFSMPENFSKDMPADDLIEVLNLTGEMLFKNNNSFTLLRRWWDFKDDALFSKNVGSMMMTIHVNKTLDESKDISHPIDFIKLLMLDMNKRDKDENKGRSENEKVLFPLDYYILYVERNYNNQRWLRAGSAAEDESQMMFHYWIPITSRHYLTVEFNFAPNNNISMRPFIDTYCRDMFEKIMSSFDIIYSGENTIKSKLENNSQLKLDSLIKQLD